MNVLIVILYMTDYHLNDKNYPIKLDNIIIMFIFVAKLGDYNTTISVIYLMFSIVYLSPNDKIISYDSKKIKWRFFNN